MPSDPQRQLLRHAVAALAYRAGKALRGAPESFAAFEAGQNVKSPVRILAHMGDLFDWALAMSQGRREWHDSTRLRRWSRNSESPQYSTVSTAQC